MSAKDEPLDSQLIVELQDIKKLLILALIHAGVSQDKIAVALQVNQSTISGVLAPPAKSR